MNEDYEYTIDYDKILNWHSEKLDELIDRYNKTDEKHTRKQEDLMNQINTVLKSMLIIQETEIMIKNGIVVRD